MDIQLLPIEILLQILAGLDAHDLLALSATSQSLRCVALHSRLWYSLLGTSRTYDSFVDYLEEYAWRHGELSVEVKSDLVPRDDELFKVLSMFPLHRSYQSQVLASLCQEYLPWAKADLAARDDELLILACHGDRMVAHRYQEDLSERHKLIVFSSTRAPIELNGLLDWPLCASLVGQRYLLVGGRFPALLLYDLDGQADVVTGIPISSHTVTCMAIEESKNPTRILMCGHYKGRGSMELISYSAQLGKLKIEIVDRNRCAGMTTIGSCTYLPGGSFVTYDNACLVVLWDSLHHAVRKINHGDGLSGEIPSDMTYKMFYHDQQLLFVDQYKRRLAFVVRVGKPGKAVDTDAQGASQETEDQEMKQRLKTILLRQSTDMASLTRRILGIY